MKWKWVVGAQHVTLHGVHNPDNEIRKLQCSRQSAQLQKMLMELNATREQIRPVALWTYAQL